MSGAGFLEIGSLAQTFVEFCQDWMVEWTLEAVATEVVIYSASQFAEFFYLKENGGTLYYAYITMDKKYEYNHLFMCCCSFKGYVGRLHQKSHCLLKIQHFWIKRIITAPRREYIASLSITARLWCLEKRKSILLYSKQ